MGSKGDMLDDLRTSLRDLFTLQSAGSTYPRLSRAQGYVDGYMKALIDARVASRAELLGVVSQEREARNGPSIGHARLDDLGCDATVRAM